MYESEDDQMEQQALTFADLLSFAFQVAKGMEFLSAKNVRDKLFSWLSEIKCKPHFSDWYL